MKQGEHLRKKQRHTYIICVAQTLPNTQLCPIIVNLLQYEHYRLGLQLGRLTSTDQDNHRHILHNKTCMS
jgi:hypothetical protein